MAGWRVLVAAQVNVHGRDACAYIDLFEFAGEGARATTVCRASLGPDSPFDYAQGRLRAAVPTRAVPIPSARPSNTWPELQIPRTLSPRQTRLRAARNDK